MNILPNFPSKYQQENQATAPEGQQKNVLLYDPGGGA